MFDRVRKGDAEKYEVGAGELPYMIRGELQNSRVG